MSFLNPPVPKVDVMDSRLGDLVDEFKQLVYPPGYDPEGKATKRKQGKIAKEYEEKTHILFVLPSKWTAGFIFVFILHTVSLEYLDPRG